MRNPADRRTLAFVAMYFALTAALFVYQPTQLWIAIPGFIAACSLSFIGAVITHNTIHVPVFRSRKINRLFQVVLTLTYGHPVSSFVPGHNLSHHNYTQSRRDVMRTSKVRFGWNLLNGLFFFVRMAPDIMRADAKYTAAMRKRRPAWFHQMLIEMAVLYIFYGALLLVDWKAFLIFVFLPHRYAAWGIITMNFLQHDGCDQDSEYDHSRNFVGPVLNYLCFNNGYHSIHHVDAGIHWAELPAAHAKTIAPHIHPDLDQPSMPAYLWRIFGWPGKRLRYDGKPVVLPAEGPDEDWIPAPNELPANTSLGAMS